MANQLKHLDLEEQEQLDELKHFWNRYGALLTWVVVLAALAFAGWSGWQYLQRQKAAQAAVLHDEIERSAQAGNVARVERALADMKDKFAGTAYAQQSGLLAAKMLYDKGNVDAARAALAWVADNAVDPGYRMVAKLRLAAVLLDAKSYDQALKLLSGEVPREFEALTADRRGDILLAQGKREEAKVEYQKAWTASEPLSDYRRLVEIKLNAVGVDSRTLAPQTGAAAVKNTP